MNANGNHKAQFDELIELSKLHRKRLDTRRSYQWKVNLALWAGLGAVAGMGVSTGLDLGASPWWVWVTTIIVMIIIIFVYIVFWTRGVTIRNDRDSRLAEAFAREAELLACGKDKLPNIYKNALGEEDPQVRDPSAMASREQWYRNWSAVSEMAFTFCMIILAVLALLWGFSHKTNTNRTVRSITTHRTLHRCTEHGERQWKKHWE